MEKRDGGIKVTPRNIWRASRGQASREHGRYPRESRAFLGKGTRK